MERLEFNSQKIQIVNIDEVRPNTWNPKEQNTEEYRKILKGVSLKGQRLPIIVRENEGFEIIDGEQRWRACKELKYEKIIIYNEGKISDKEAKELTIWYQQQVPFNEIKLAELVADLSNLDNLELPYTEEEIKNYEDLLSFNWEQYGQEFEEKEKNQKEITCPECGHKFKI